MFAFTILVCVIVTGHVMTWQIRIRINCEKKEKKPMYFVGGSSVISFPQVAIPGRWVRTLGIDIFACYFNTALHIIISGHEIRIPDSHILTAANGRVNPALIIIGAPCLGL